MPGNPTPIYSKVGAYGFAKVTAASTRSDGTGTVGTDMFLAFTADATNGSFVQRIRWNPTANAASLTTTATVGRVFISSSNTAANTNCTLFQEVALPSVIIANTTTAAYPIDIPMNIALPPAYAILVSNHAAPAANTAWVASVVAGNY
jgi:hypothetical protein